MTKKAIIQGEIHIFHTDRKSLMQRDIDKYQALYQEGRDEVIYPHRYRNRYYIYVIGILTLKLIYNIFSYGYKHLDPGAGYNIEKEAREAGLAFDDNIDLNINEIFDSYSILIVNFTLIGLVVVFGAIFMNSFRADTLDFWIISTPIPWWLLTLVFAVLLPFIYSSLLISYANTGDRDKKMASTIDRKCDDRGQDAILILVGDKHVEPIGDQLDRKGWEVDEQRSNHIIGRIYQKLEST